MAEKESRGTGGFKVGDRVEVHTISFLGTGTILDISTDYTRGFGTKLYPSYLIELDDGISEWFNGRVLHLI